MKNLLFLLFSVLIFGQKIDTIKINSKIFGEERQLVVYTPYDYEIEPKQYFDVIYVLDAQIHFQTDQVISTSFFEGKSFFANIVVGIISNNRQKDFLPKNNHTETSERYNGNLGNADKLFDFLKQEAIPFIDKNYRTLPTKVLVGHSLGATFTSFCFLKDPNLFDGYLAISPNFEYDNFQFADRFQNFNTDNIKKKKFFYMCNANEDLDFSKNWKIGREKVIKILNKPNFKNKILFINQDFSISDDHSSVYPLGVANGLKQYFDYYQNADELMNLYDAQSKIGKYDLTPERANYMAYNFFYCHKPIQDAIKILLWANKKFPENLNIYDSIGEMYQNLGDKINAEKYYKMLGEKIETVKSTLKPEEYQQLKDGVKGRLDYLKKMK